MSKWAYYNDNDPFVCDWTRNLIAAGLIADGEVDCRPIQEVKADDVRGFRQCHFFNGIAGWAYALRLAGWPDDGPRVWTGSCPCQPLSSAGKRQGTADQRHLWPAFFELIAECSPPVIFGEQVASKSGREWLAGIRVDLESVGYACGAADLPAASVGAPHARQRLFWMGYTDAARLQRRSMLSRNKCSERTPWSASQNTSRMGDSECRASEYQRCDMARTPRKNESEISKRKRVRPNPWSNGQFVLCGDDKARRIEPRFFPLALRVPGDMGRIRAYGNAIVPQVAALFIEAAVEAMQESMSDDNLLARVR